MEGIKLNYRSAVGGPTAVVAGPECEPRFAGAAVVAPRLSGAVVSLLQTPIANESVSSQAEPFRLPNWKRALDIVLILLISPALLLIFLFVSICIKLVSRGPVFFSQSRVGCDGKLFRCLKFRTMHADNDSGVHRQHLANLMKSKQPMKKLDSIGDPRVIPLGGLLRSSGLDELPQLINVLRGDMSVVGPRPCTPYEYELYQDWHKRRLSTLPGLTGLWQVSGKNKTTFDEMVCMDIAYAENLSPWLDLKIIAKTFPTLLRQTASAVTAPSSHPPGYSCRSLKSCSA